MGKISPKLLGVIVLSLIITGCGTKKTANPQAEKMQDKIAELREELTAAQLRLQRLEQVYGDQIFRLKISLQSEDDARVSAAAGDPLPWASPDSRDVTLRATQLGGVHSSQIINPIWLLDDAKK